MHFGIIPVNIGVETVAQMIGLAQCAEAAGFESVWTFEHVIVPIDYASKYPYNDSGKMGAEPETNFVDPLIALSAVAAQTSTIRLVSCPRNNFMKLRRIFRRWQGTTTSSGRPHGRRSNAVNGEKDQQICEVISGTGH